MAATIHLLILDGELYPRKLVFFKPWALSKDLSNDCS
jgi:hypothetical protein